MKKKIRQGSCVIDIEGKDTSDGFKMRMKFRGDCKGIMGEDYHNK